MKIVLISCCSKKQKGKFKAENLYISDLFKKSLDYAKSINPDKILILSAKYGVLNLTDIIEDYNLTLNNMNSKLRKDWSINVLSYLATNFNIENDEFIFLTGNKYNKYILPFLKNYKLPLGNLKFGQRLHWLKNNVLNNNKSMIKKSNTCIIDYSKSDDTCLVLHKWFNKLERFTFPFDENKIPLNGIYILFEKGEKLGNLDRIVRVGTHTGKNQLRSRLNQHFLMENKDRSIFRKNIGRAILNKNKDPFLKYWEKDLTTRENRLLFSKDIDFTKQRKIEKKVSKYIRNNFSFVVFEVNSKEKRLELETKIIATVSLYNRKHSIISKNWLGLYSPKQKIADSGLWLVNGLYKKSLTNKDIDFLITILC